ncbi:hypothetical protein ACHIPZ_07775 [Antrihabitans sp. NCIMB 15449]|uniref:Uncharacterized protein n=2 Tax=Antrihabitans spumae TaxID=3373370 RepID=A0ABW7JK43_9NOCA
MSRTDDAWAASWKLSLRELAALRAMQVRMMHRDVTAERKAKAEGQKTDQLAAFASETARLLAGLPVDSTNDAESDMDGSLADAPDQVDLDAIAHVASKLAAGLTERSQAVVVLIELMTFYPWSGGAKWNPKARDGAITDAAIEMPGLAPDDFATLTTEFDALVKQLRRKSIRWGRVAAMTVVGLGAGALTGGLAAPAVGAAVGGTLGLSGAAATSAGLAALGGGSLAAGGFGVAGGTLLVTGVGGLTAAGVAGASTRFSRLGSGSIALDAIKLDLIARVLITDSEDRDQKMRRVAESLAQVANDLSKKVNLLSERITQLKEKNRVLTEENNTLRAKVSQLGADLRQLRDAEIRELRAELQVAEQDKSTVEVVLERLEEKVGQ